MPSTDSSANRTAASGLVRWSGFIPLGLLALGLTLYFIFLFDIHLKRLIEKTSSTVNGAQVNLASLRTSFLKCELEIRDVQVTNHLHPMKNRFEIERVHFQFLFGPLLRKKLVIEDMSVTGVHYGTDRTASGELPQELETGGAPSLVDRVSTHLFKELRGQFDQSPLKHLGQLATGFDLRSQLSGIEADLTSLKRIDDIKDQIGSLRPDDYLKSLPSPDSVKDYQQKISAVANIRAVNPQEIAQSIQAVKKIKGELSGQTEQVVGTLSKAKGEINQLSQGISQIDGLVNADVQRIKSMLKLPRVDIPDFSQIIFGPKILSGLERLTYWIDLVRRRMPKGSKDTKVRTVEIPRARGTDIYFGKATRYPGFLLRHAAVSSDLATDSRKGEVKGKIEGLTSDPPLYGKPMIASLDANFPASQINGARVELLVDHTGNENLENVKLAVASFPVADLKFSESPDLAFGIRKSVGRYQMNLAFREEGLRGTMQTSFRAIDYKLTSRIKRVEDIFQKVLGTVDSFDLSATLTGSFDNLKFEARSDLGQKLASGIQTEFRHQVASIEDGIRSKIRDQVEGKKEEALNKLRETQSKLLLPIETRLKSLEEVQLFADTSIERLQNEGKRQAKEEANKLKGQAGKELEKQTETLKRTLKIPGL